MQLLVGDRLGREAAELDVGAAAAVEGAVLWERVEVGEGAVLRDAYVGSGARSLVLFAVRANRSRANESMS